MIPTTERNGNRDITNIGAAIIRKTQRMRHLNLFVHVETIFEPPLIVGFPWDSHGFSTSRNGGTKHRE